MRDPLIFSRSSPVANVYEYKLGQLVTQKEGRKNMEHVNTITDTGAMVPVDELDRVEPLTDAEIEAILATSEFTQDAEDIAPEIEAIEPTRH